MDAPWIGDDGFKALSQLEIDDITADYEERIQDKEDEIVDLEIEGDIDDEIDVLKLELQELKDELECFLEDPVERKYY